MSYTLVDLLEKLIIIEKNACKLYRNIASLSDVKSTKYKSAAVVLAKEEERHVTFYERIKESIEKQEKIEIDFNTYDKASTLIFEFEKRMSKAYVDSVEDLVKFAYNFERENVALLLSIQGRFVGKKFETDSLSYSTFTKLIEEERKHVKNIEAFMKV